MINSTNHKTILNFAFLFLPVSFILGAAIVEISFFIFLVLSYLIFKKKIFIIKLKKVLFFFLIFYVYLNFNSAFSVEPLISYKKSLPYFRFFLIICALVYYLNINPDILLKKKKIFLYLIIILTLDSLFQFFTSKNIIGLPIFDEKSYRVSSFFGSELILGSYVSKLFPIILSILFFEKDFKKKHTNYEIIILSIFIFLICILSGERVAVLHVIMIILYLFFLYKNKKLKKILISILILFSLFIALTDNVIKKRLVDNTINSFTYKETGTIKSNLMFFSETHHSHILSSYKMFQDKVFFGNGLKSYKYLCDKKEFKINDLSCSTHPHNTYLLFLSELGLVGLIFYLISFIYFLRSFFKLLFKTRFLYAKSLQCITVGLLFFYLPIPTGSFFNNFFSFQFFYLIAFYFFYLNLYKKNK